MSTYDIAELRRTYDGLSEVRNYLLPPVNAILAHLPAVLDDLEAKTREVERLTSAFENMPCLRTTFDSWLVGSGECVEGQKLCHRCAALAAKEAQAV